jgi:MFS family permease
VSAVSVQNRSGLTAQASPPVQRRLGLALLVIAAAELMLVLDDTIVNVALPSMQRSLHLATSHLNWVISFYALAFGGLMLAGGRAGDLFGRLRVFRLGVAVFTLASLAGGFAPNGPALIASRVVQGCGAAIAAPCALSLLATTFPAGPARTRALGVYGAMGGLGSVVGLLLGGALTEYLSWRWVLFINAPIAVLVLIGTGVLVPGDTERGTLDVPGAIAATLGVGSVIFALTRGNTNGWNDPGTLVSFAAGGRAAGRVRPDRATQPGADGAAPAGARPQPGWRERGDAAPRRGMLAMFYLLTLYMQVVRGYSAVHTGLAYLPFVVGRRRGLRRAGAAAARRAARPDRHRGRNAAVRRRAGLVRGHADPGVGLLRGDAPGHAGRRDRHRADLRRLHRDRHAGGRARATAASPPACSTPASRSAARSAWARWPPSPRW